MPLLEDLHLLIHVDVRGLLDGVVLVEELGVRLFKLQGDIVVVTKDLEAGQTAFPVLVEAADGLVEVGEHLQFVQAVVSQQLNLASCLAYALYVHLFRLHVEFCELQGAIGTERLQSTVLVP